MTSSTLLLIALIGLALFLTGIAIGTLLLGKSAAADDPRVPELTAALQSREAYARSADATVSQLQQQLGATREQLKMMEEQEQAAPRTEAELAHWRTRSQELERELAERSTAYDEPDEADYDEDARRELEALREADVRREAEVQALREAEAQHAREVEALRAEIEQVEADYADQLATVRLQAAQPGHAPAPNAAGLDGEARDELDRLQGTLAEEYDRMRRDRDEVASFKETMAQQTRDLEAERARLADLSERLQARAETHDETREALARQREELDARHAELEAQREQLTRDHDALDEQRALHRQQLDDVREREDEVERRVSEVTEQEQQNAEQREKLGAFRERLRQGELTLRKRLAVVEAKETETNEHASLIESERDAVLTQRQEILDYKATVDQQQADVDRSREDIAAERKRMAEERDAMKAREARLEAKTNEQAEDFLGRIRELEARLEAQEDEAQQMQRELRHAHQEADDQRLLLQRHIDELTSDLDLRTTQLQRMETRAQAAEGTVRQQQAVLATSRPGFSLVQPEAQPAESHEDEAPEAPQQLADELTRIPGVTLALQQRLYQHGITRYEHIAGWSGPDVRKYALWLGVEAWRVQNQWVPQARQLATRSTETSWATV